VTHHIVIGAGIAGAAAAWKLAVRGEQVTVLERTTPANRLGSSHGSARIFRYAYTDPLYARLAIEALSEWRELERLSSTTLLTETGSVDFGTGRDPRVLAEVFESLGVEHELLDPDAARARWPQFAFDSPVLWHGDAGVLDPSTAVEAMLERATATGNARLLTDWEVASVERASTGSFRVTSTSAEAVVGDRVIFAAGGWLPDLLPGLGLPDAFIRAFPPLIVRQEQAFHLPYRDEYDQGWPTFIHKDPSGNTYGLPGGRDAEDRGQKFAFFNGGDIIPSARAQEGRITEQMRARVVDYARRYLPGLVPEPYAETTCLFTSTPTEDFVIDESDGVVIVSACSGHGAKFAPLLGEFAASLATGTGAVPERFRVGAV
jgi:sarcosine oxidase